MSGRLHRHPITGEPLALTYPRVRTTTTWFDEDLGRRLETLRRKLPGRPSQLRLLSFEDQVRRVVFTTEGNGTLPRQYLHDRDRPDALVSLARAHEGLEAAVEARPVSYDARDGLTIPAYLTLPPDRRNDEPLPTVLLPHGGPWARDTGGFHYWVQFLVSRGYAVLQPNFSWLQRFRGPLSYSRHW